MLRLIAEISILLGTMLLVFLTVKLISMALVSAGFDFSVHGIKLGGILLFIPTWIQMRHLFYYHQV